MAALAGGNPVNSNVRHTPAVEYVPSENEMNVHIERYDESCPPDENGNIFCPHTGVTYTFSEQDKKLIFRRDDSEPTTASLLYPRGWYVDLFDTVLYQQAAEYLQKEGISKLTAYSQMNGVAIPLPVSTEKPDSRNGA